MKKIKNKRIWLFSGVVITIVLLNRYFDWSSYLMDVGNIQFLRELVHRNLAVAVGIYMVFTIVGSVILALPGVTFAIMAGVLFGPILGTICCSIAATLGAIFSFLLGRFFLKDSIKPLVMKNQYLKKWLFEGHEANELFVLMITRLVPVFPYNLQNFAYGITDISVVTYSIYSFVFMLPGTAMYTIGTVGVTTKENKILYIGIAIALAVIVIGIGTFLKKRYIQKGRWLCGERKE